MQKSWFTFILHMLFHISSWLGGGHLCLDNFILCRFCRSLSGYTWVSCNGYGFHYQYIGTKWLWGSGYHSSGVFYIQCRGSHSHLSLIRAESTRSVPALGHGTTGSFARSFGAIFFSKIFNIQIIRKHVAASHRALYRVNPRRLTSRFHRHVRLYCLGRAQRATARYLTPTFAPPGRNGTGFSVALALHSRSAYRQLANDSGSDRYGPHPCTGC